MSAMQKFAWFNLAVIALTLMAVVSLFPFLGKGALGGFGFLGLTGFGPYFFRKKPGHVLADERDQLIQRGSIPIKGSCSCRVSILQLLGLRLRRLDGDARLQLIGHVG
jgi:hypothetical protein